MKNPLGFLKKLFNPQAAIENGWAHEHPKPVLSEKKKKELMESSTLESSRSNIRAVFSILAPYWTKASVGERVKGATLLGASLFMTWYAVQMTVDFGNWLGGLGNTTQQVFQTMMSERPEIIADTIPSYPELEDYLEQDDQLNDLLMKYPDTTSILYDPEFEDLLEDSPALKAVLEKNPTLEDVFMNYPGFEEDVAQNPELLQELSSFRDEVGDKLSSLPSIKTHLGNMLAMCGGDCFTNVGDTMSATYNLASDAVNKGEADTQPVIQALKKTWDSKDLITLVLKFTATAIISFKAAQYLGLRWRAWTTGHYTNKWMSSKAYARLKNHFNNIDNPGQRIQEDPAKFTSGFITLTTGATQSTIQFASFFGVLWGMGTVMGVPGGMFWTAFTFATAVTAMSVAVGKNLPSIQRNQQRREADLRNALDKIHENAGVIAQNDGEEVENALVKSRFKPVMKNSLREIGTQVKLIVVDATTGNLAIPIPYIAGAFAVAAGTASVGTIQTIYYAFNRMTTAMSFFVSNFEKLSQLLATADRIHTFDTAVEAARYIEAERAQAALEAVPPKLLEHTDDPALPRPAGP